MENVPWCSCHVIERGYAVPATDHLLRFRISNTNGMGSRIGKGGKRRNSWVTEFAVDDKLGRFRSKATSLQSRLGQFYGWSLCDTDCEGRDRARDWTLFGRTHGCSPRNYHRPTGSFPLDGRGRRVFVRWKRGL